LSSDDRAASAPAPEPATPGPDSQPDQTAPRGPSKVRIAVILVVAVVIIDVLATILVPPYPKGQPGEPVSSISDLIVANLELPAPEIVIPPHHEPPPGILFWDVSITNTIITTWLVIAVVLVIALIVRLTMKWLPGRFQNFVEWAWEGLEGWAYGLGGEGVRRHIPLFVAFFLFILFSNWSGLIPLIGKVDFLRAPTSDVNVTIGLALVVFFYFQYQGFRVLGIRAYLGKFFDFSGFKEGPAAGLIGLFVGLIEFMLEFIKPVTLAMRLFGNIYGGEVALGVITALTIVVVPAAFLLLEGLLNFVQALIFSTLMLMYTIIAVEVHDEEHEEHSPIPEGGIAAPIPAGSPAH
jgi:F-type H+-transporting ATPase subunit a